MVLAMVAAERGWPSNRWATYRAWQRHGCQVRRGERGTRSRVVEAHRATAGRRVRRRRRSRLDRCSPGSSPSSPPNRPTDADRFVPQPGRGRYEARVADAELYFASVGARRGHRRRPSLLRAGARRDPPAGADTVRPPVGGLRDRSTRAHPLDRSRVKTRPRPQRTIRRSRLRRRRTDRGARRSVLVRTVRTRCQPPATTTPPTSVTGSRCSAADARALVAACGHAQRAVDYLNQTAAWIPPVDQEADVA